MRAMRQAQSQLLGAFIRKNQLIAATFEHQAASIDQARLRKARISKSEVVSLRSAALSFRGHEAREAVLVEKFEKASSLLLDQVQECLNPRPDLASAN